MSNVSFSVPGGFGWIGVMLLLSASIPQIARAEGRCPPGQYPVGGQGVLGCAPMGSSSSGWSPPSQGRKYYWGAITLSTNGLIGVSRDGRTKRSAIRKAIKHCEIQGGLNCHSVQTFHRQCAALVIPHEGARIYTTATAADAKTARAKAITHCEEQGGIKCEVFHSDCPKIVVRY